MTDYNQFRFVEGETDYPQKFNNLIDNCEIVDDDLTVVRGATIVAGDGLLGGGDKKSDRDVSLGDPGDLDNTSTNSVTPGSHAHSVDSATQLDAETGTNDAKLSTTLNVTQFLNNKLSDAGDVNRGTVEQGLILTPLTSYMLTTNYLANPAETISQTPSGELLLSPSVLPSFYEDRKATLNETKNGIVSDKYITPLVNKDFIDQEKTVADYTFGNWGQSFVKNVVNMSLPLGDWRSGAWSEQLGRFVLSSIGYNIALYSSDGVSWNDTPQSGDINSVVWCSGLSLFVSVGNGRVSTSPDGITWTTNTTGSISGNNWRDVVYYTDGASINILVAVSSGNTKIMTSTDGLNWTFPTTNLTGDYYGVTFSESLNLFIAVGDGDTLATSSDGQSWSELVTGAGGQWRSITYSTQLGVAVAVGTVIGTETIVFSEDGVNWNSVNQMIHPTSPPSFTDVEWVESLGLFVAVGSHLSLSSDGKNWTPVEKTNTRGVAAVVSETLGMILFPNGLLTPHTRTL